MSFDIFDNFATNEKLEVTGVWHDLDITGESRIRVARMDNPKYQAEMSKLFAEFAKELEAEPSEKRSEPGSITRKIMAKGMAAAILLDWENLSYKGKVLKYSQENAEVVLAHKDFIELILRLSNDITNFQQELEEEQVKNSQKS